MLSFMKYAFIALASLLPIAPTAHAQYVGPYGGTVQIEQTYADGQDLYLRHVMVLNRRPITNVIVTARSDRMQSEMKLRTNNQILGTVKLTPRLEEYKFPIYGNVTRDWRVLRLAFEGRVYVESIRIEVGLRNSVPSEPRPDIAPFLCEVYHDTNAWGERTVAYVHSRQACLDFCAANIRWEDQEDWRYYGGMCWFDDGQWRGFIRP